MGVVFETTLRANAASLMRGCMAALLLLAAFSPRPCVAQNPPIVLAADPWCPVNCIPRSNTPGYAVEAAKRIFSAMGIRVEYKAMPWSRALVETHAGRVDGAIGVYRPEAPGFVFPVEEIGLSDNGFFIPSHSDWTYDGLDSLKKVRTAFIGGYDYGEPIDSYIRDESPSPNILISMGEHALEMNFLMLSRGRVDVVMADVIVGQHFIAHFTGKDAVRFAGAEGIPEPIYIAFSPSRSTSARYARIWDEGIRRLRTSGELASILDKYGLKDWKHTPKRKNSRNIP